MMSPMCSSGIATSTSITGSSSGGPRLLGGGLEAEGPGQLEGHLVRVDGMVLAVDAAHPDVDDREARQGAVRKPLEDALLDGRDQVARDRAADDLVDELESAPTGQRLHAQVADPEHALAAGLLLQLPLHVLDLARDRLAVRDLRAREIDLEVEHALQAAGADPDVQLAHAGQQELTGVGVAIDVQRRVFLDEARERREELVLVGLGLRGDRVGEHALRNRDRRELDAALLAGDRVARVHVLQLRDGDDVARPGLGDLDVFGAAHQVELAEPLLRAGRRVQDRRVGMDRARDHAEHREQSLEAVDHGLEHDRGEGAVGVGVELSSRRRPRGPSRSKATRDTGRRQQRRDGFQQRFDAESRSPPRPRRPASACRRARPRAGRRAFRPPRVRLPRDISRAARRRTRRPLRPVARGPPSRRPRRQRAGSIAPAGVATPASTPRR